MRKILALVVALCLAPIGAQAWWQSVAQQSVSVAATYQGPGDIVSGALIWGSCSRVYNVSLASTSTSLCDLVDTSVGGTAICTLRGSSTGFVDLTGSYCTGSATPAVACAAAAGGACRVSKVYDQIGGTSGWVNATHGQRPVFTFSAQNSLPGLTGTAAANTFLNTSSTFTQAQPWTLVAVGKRTANFTTSQSLIGSSGSLNDCLSYTTSASTAGFTSDGASTITLGSVTDSNFHAVQGVAATSPNGVLAVDGVETTGNVGTGAFSANTSRIMRCAGGLSLDGVWLEGGLWPVGFDATQRGNINSNIHSSTSGYNF